MSLRQGGCVAVIGGGQSAGQLALEASRFGASVALVSRAPCRIADLDVDAGWLMEDHLAPFRSQTDPADRSRTLEQVRSGSMTADLDAALQASSVCRLHGVGDIEIRPSGSGAVVVVPGLELAVDRVVLATGWQPDLRADAALRTIAEDGAPHVDGLPVLDQHLQWVDDFHVVGALAALTIGPAAGNLGGARAAADALADHAPRRRLAVPRAAGTSS